MFNKVTKELVLPYRQFKNIMGGHDNWVEYILIKRGFMSTLMNQLFSIGNMEQML